MDGVFVVGTDTGVGKTVVCAGLLKLLRQKRQAVYWKPVQISTMISDDTQAVADLTGLGPEALLEPVYRFSDPLSPYLAARKAKVSIDVDRLMEIFHQKRKEGVFVVIEGAGGILVPYAESTLQIEFIKRTGLPALIVGRDRVGTVNHTLLTLMACRQFEIDVLGVILTYSRGEVGNADSITHFGSAELLAELPPWDNPHQVVKEISRHEELNRRLL